MTTQLIITRRVVSVVRLYAVQVMMMDWSSDEGAVSTCVLGEMT